MRQWPPLSGGYSENFASHQPRQALGRARPEGPGRPRLRARAGARGRRAGREQPPRRRCSAWAWAGTGSAPRKPSLVYCSISAFGQDGPRAREGGFDLTIQAAAGVMSVTGEPDGAPVKCGVPLSDFAAGPLCRLPHRRAARARARRRPRRARSTCRCSPTTLAIAALQTSEYFGTGQQPAQARLRPPAQRALPGLSRAPTAGSPSPPATTSCGRRCARWSGAPELLADARFATTDAARRATRPR